MDPYDLVVAQLEGRNGQYVCPAHEDNVASLSVERGDTGVVLHCHAGCEPKLIIDQLGLSWDELFTEKRNVTEEKAKPEVVATYDYVDEKGEPLYQVRRYVPKKFSQHKWSGTEWETRLGDARRVPYRLPELLAAEDRWVFLVEGEKDADTLASHGFLATTTAGGAKGWTDEMADFFREVRLALCPDNDPPGLAYVQAVAESLKGSLSECKMVILPGVPKKGDVSDYFARGGTVEELKLLVKSAPSYQMAVGSPPESRNPVPGSPLSVTRASDVAPSQTEWLWPGRIPYGKITIIDGNPGQGKSTMTLDLVARLSRGGGLPPNEMDSSAVVSSVLLSAEDGLEDTIVPRLRAAGAELDHIFAINSVQPTKGPERPWQLPSDLEYLRDLVVTTGARVVVIDPLMAYLEPGVSSNNDQHIRRALHPLKDLADDTGAAVLIVRHLRKSREGIAMLQGGGSIGIIGAARAGLVVGTDPHDATGKGRVVAVSKMNLGEPGESLAFHLESSEGAGRIEWDGISPHTAETMLAQVSHDDVEAIGACGEWLKRMLDGDDVPLPELLKRSRAMGYSDKILARARKMLGIVDTFHGDDVYWSLTTEKD